MNQDSNVGSDAKLPLPPGWMKGFSKSQKKSYYYHPETKHTQWHFPTVSEAANPLKAKQRLQTNLVKKRTSSNTETDTANSHKKHKTNTHNYNSNNEATLGNILPSSESLVIQKPSSSSKAQTSTTSSSSTNHQDLRSIAIIVPFRDMHPAQQRSKHVQTFVPFMINFLQKQLDQKKIIDYHIYIIEQSNDKRKFNRGKLLNIGFDIARKNKGRRRPTNNNHNSKAVEMVDHDVFIFHDVDLLPTSEEILAPYYTQFPTVPIHIARVWDRYSNNPKYFGGIVSFSASDMKRINGYPNTFWGWGGEDDEMQKRCERLNIKWTSPTMNSIHHRHSSNNNNKKPIITDLENMDIKEKLTFLRSNKNWKCNVKWEALDEHETTWRRNGLADLDYKILTLTDIDPKTASSSDTESINATADGNSYRSRATRVTVDVKLNGNHWSNEKCHIDQL